MVGTIETEGKKDVLKFSIPNKPEYVSVIRLTTSAIASRIGFNIDEIDDIKVSIGEACTNIIKHGLEGKEENFDIEYVVSTDRLDIILRDNGKGFDTSIIEEPGSEELRESGLGIFIIKSLMDEVEINSSEGRGTEIKMSKVKNS
ncbi:serine-protein kinase RsbW [Gottschalkia purinilytica]|uniref:Serine-protein kinase RsbW n=1 Tax=Gottschalkia purinilytica TaxID=1503 RepID=A0A0L0W767_GOTPU|nr:ATP-binding protein [Gottschalkia purinilytica]KNF07317.1 serine-protein kinase RsbW [Gottschalkia purinilytica]